MFSNYLRPANSHRVDKRKVRSDPSTKVQLAELSAVHHKILNMAVLGMSNSDIAAELGITTRTVSYTINSDLGKMKMAVMQIAADEEAFDVMKKINSLLPKALEVYENILDIGAVADKLKVADKLLDRAGFVPPQVIKGDHKHGHVIVNIDDIKERGRLLRERGVVADDVIDIQSAECGTT